MENSESEVKSIAAFKGSVEALLRNLTSDGGTLELNGVANKTAMEQCVYELKQTSDQLEVHFQTMAQFFAIYHPEQVKQDEIQELQQYSNRMSELIETHKLNLDKWGHEMATETDQKNTAIVGYLPVRPPSPPLQNVSPGQKVDANAKLRSEIKKEMF